MIRKLLLLAVVASIPACAAPLTAQGRAVRLMKGDPPSHCVEIGPVNGRAPASGGAMDPAFVIEQSKNVMRNKAADMGADYVRWEAADDGAGLLTGTAYRCGNPASG